MHRLKYVLVVLLGLSLHPLPAPAAEHPVTHLVLVWLKDPGNAEHRARVIDATRALAGIPGLEDLQVGEPVPSDRAIVDDSFDVGIAMVFVSKQALDDYLVHPRHQAAVANVLKPLCARFTVYDFESTRPAK